MFERLDEAEKRYEEISERISDPEVMGDMEEYRKLMREYKILGPVVEKLREYKKWKKIGEKVDFWVDGTVCNSLPPTQISTGNHIARFSKTTTVNKQGTYLFEKFVCCLSEIKINSVSCILSVIQHGNNNKI